MCRLSAAQLARLHAELDNGPAVHGWAEDQRWTLEQVATLIRWLFHIRYTLRGTSYLLHRSGFTPQVPYTGLPSATRPRSPPGGR